MQTEFHLILIRVLKLQYNTSVSNNIEIKIKILPGVLFIHFNLCL
jgi:hypothetical protein